ncbi:hypothetical protein ACHAQJ_006729 [Trichoderma viride]
MKLNEIEEFTDPVLERSISFKSLEEALKSGLVTFHKLRTQVALIALKGTVGAYGCRIAENVEEYKMLYAFLTKFVDDVYNTSVKEVQLQRELEERRKAAERKTVVSRLRKIKSALKSDSDDVFEALAKERDERLAELDNAMELMQKHCVLINLAQDTMVWDAEAYFRRRGVKQGKLFTNGFEAKHFTKLANGIWSVQMKWTAVRKSEWRPGTVYVDRRFGRFDKTKIDWVKMAPARIVSGPGDVEFDVNIQVRDELFYEEQGGEFKEEYGRRLM